jgi:hypothetical protein
MNISEIFAHESFSIAGVDIIDVPGFTELVLRFALNTGIILLLVRWLYYSNLKRKDYLFTYILISSVVFLLCFLLESVKLQIGFALGLFAIFGIIRYRTDSMPIKEMTYLFLVIGISVINALTSEKTSLADLLFTNGALIGITYGLEKIWLLKHEASKIITYEKINLIKPDKYNELLDDLRERTGLKGITRAEIGKIDFMKDVCTVTIFYDTTETRLASAGTIEEPDDDDE